MIAKNVHILTAMHLLVDALCACCLFLIVPRIEGSYVLPFFLLYSLLAFVGQPFAGMAVDQETALKLHPLSLAVLFLTAGCVATLGACGTVWGGAVWLAPVLLGIGNALFHVFGGKHVAVTTHNDIRPLGIFVSTGAVGLVLGEVFCSVALLLTLLLAIVALWRMYCGVASVCSAASSDISRESASTSAAPICLLVVVLLVVFFRSFLGRMIPTSAFAPVLAMWLAVPAVLGKASGGYLSTRFGLRPTFILSLIVAALGFLVCSASPWLTFITVFALNISMPITLHLALRTLPRQEGFTFGLLAAALLPGYLLAMLWSGNTTVELLLTALLPTIVIEVLVLLALRERRWQVLTLCAVMNVLTNVPLNLYCTAHIPSPSAVLLLELVVILVEAALYRLVLPNFRRSIVYSALCNFISFHIGYIIQIII